MFSVRPGGKPLVIELRMLGDLDLRGPDGRQLREALVQPKRFALLAYLAVAQGGQRRRDTLLGLFWPESDESHARDALKQAVSHLRRTLAVVDEPLIVGRGVEELSLNSRVVWSDVAAFVAAVNAGDLKQALDLYGGDLLQGFFSNGSAAFDDWLGRERTRLRGLACEAAQQLSQQAAAHGDLGSAVKLARRAIDLSDLDEQVLRQLMRLLDAAGDRAGAIRAFDDFARRLAAEYDAVPSAETRDLLERVRLRHTLNGAASTQHPDEPFRSSDLTADAVPASVIEPRVLPVRRGGWRARPPAAVIAMIALCAAIVAIVGTSLALRSSGPVASDRPRVAVATFDDLARDTALVNVGRLAAERLTQGVAQMASLEAIPSGAVATAAAEARRKSEGVVQAVAKATHASDVVTGSITRTGDSIQVSASIIDTRTNRVIRSIGPIAGSASDPLIAIDAVRDRLLGSFAAGDLTRRIVFGTQPPKYSAIREFQAATDRLVRYKDVEGAVRLYEHAIQLDSTYVAAYAGLAAAWMQRGALDQVQRVLDRTTPLGSQLTVGEQLHLDFFRARLRGDNTEVLRICQRLLVEDDSTGVDLTRIGWAADQLLRPRDAIPALLASEATNVASGSQRHFILLAEAYHEAGAYVAELSALERGRKAFPENSAYAARELVAYAGLGQQQAAERLADSLLASVSASGAAGFPDVISGANEFRAHGEPAAGDRLTRKVIAWFASRTWQSTRPREMILGRAFYEVAALDSAAIHFRRAAADSTGIDAVGYMALIAARQAFPAQARIVADSLAVNPPRWDFGLTIYWRAAILGALGDRAQAVQLLRQASQRGQGMAGWHADDALVGLREFPPFKTLVVAQK